MLGAMEMQNTCPGIVAGACRRAGRSAFEEAGRYRAVRIRPVNSRAGASAGVSAGTPR
jgi:hypothetical protein